MFFCQHDKMTICDIEDFFHAMFSAIQEVFKKCIKEKFFLPQPS